MSNRCLCVCRSICNLLVVLVYVDCIGNVRKFGNGCFVDGALHGLQGSPDAPVVVPGHLPPALRGPLEWPPLGRPLLMRSGQHPLPMRSRQRLGQPLLMRSGQHHHLPMGSRHHRCLQKMRHFRPLTHNKANQEKNWTPWPGGRKGAPTRPPPVPAARMSQGAVGSWAGCC